MMPTLSCLVPIHESGLACCLIWVIPGFKMAASRGFSSLTQNREGSPFRDRSNTASRSFRCKKGFNGHCVLILPRSVADLESEPEAHRTTAGKAASGERSSPCRGLAGASINNWFYQSQDLPHFLLDKRSRAKSRANPALSADLLPVI